MGRDGCQAFAAKFAAKMLRRIRRKLWMGDFAILLSPLFGLAGRLAPVVWRQGHAPDILWLLQSNAAQQRMVRIDINHASFRARFPLRNTWIEMGRWSRKATAVDSKAPCRFTTIV